MEKPRHQRAEVLDQAGIVGARWWHKGLADAQRRQIVTRRVFAGFVAAAAIAGIGYGMTRVAAISAGPPPASAYKQERKPSLEMQQRFGWSFGATGENVTFADKSTYLFLPDVVAHLVSALEPSDPRLLPFYVSTLPASADASPREQPTADPATVETPKAAFARQGSLVPATDPTLADGLRKMTETGPTKELANAYADGLGLGTLLAGQKLDAAVVVDLPGPLSVALAAGAAEVLDPVLLFDNWPHPRGVVPAHQTLAALAHYAHRFEATRTARPTRAPALFVLDKNRLATYSSDASQFDNRHLAKLPPPAALKGLDYRRLLYVVETDRDLELADLTDLFVELVAGGIDVKILPLTSMRPTGEAGSPRGYRGDASAVPFLVEYGWAEPGAPPLPAGWERSPGSSYRPEPHWSLFASGKAYDPNARSTPDGFATVPAYVGSDGKVAGAVASRSGSWNRASTSGGG